MTRTLLTEAQTQATATAVEGRPGRFLLQLITPGWGASGYYASEVLEAAVRDKVFAQGMHLYLDHPHGDGSGVDERGNRSVKDLASVLAEDARLQDGAIVAEAIVFSPHRQVLAEMIESIGLSIRAYAETRVGEAEGRTGTIIEQLVEARSTDFVTRAGRGGRILQVLESATEVTESRNIGQWIESRIHRDFTITADDMAGEGRLTREERIGLSSAIGEALAAFVTSLETNQPQLYKRDLWDDPQDTVAAAIEAAKNVPGHPAGRTNRSEEDTMPEIAESELNSLREAAGRVQTLESERDAAVQRAATAESERDEARGELAESARTATVARILSEAAEAAQVALDEDQQRGIATRAVLNEDRTVNESETRRVFDERIATLKESQGSPIHGFGRGTTTQTTVDAKAIAESLDALDDAVFGAIRQEA